MVRHEAWKDLTHAHFELDLDLVKNHAPALSMISTYYVRRHFNLPRPRQSDFLVFTGLIQVSYSNHQRAERTEFAIETGSSHSFREEAE